MPPKPRRQYKPEAMQMALQMVRDGKLSKKAAAKAYGIPKTTLLDKLAGRVPDTTPLGRKTVLTPAEEKTLVEYVNLMCGIGYPLKRREFLLEVQRILNLDGRKTPFSNNMPGKDWFMAFMKRHKEMSFRTPLTLGHERAGINMDMVNNWFNGVINYLQKEVPGYEELLKDPRRIFNADESGFPLSMKTGRVLAPTGARHVYQVSTSNKTQITVMAGFNAFGEYLPPMILLPGERIRDVGLSGFPEAMYAATPNGWMDSDAFIGFLESCNEFVTKKDIQKPILLFVDGHSTHLTLKAAEYCKANGIILYCLLANATHILQAADIGLFSPLKSSWHAAVKRWQMANVGHPMTKRDFPAVFRDTWQQVATFHNAANGFQRSGLFPFNADRIDKSRLEPSKMIVADGMKTPADQQEAPGKVDAGVTETADPMQRSEVDETGPSEKIDHSEVTENQQLLQPTNAESNDEPAQIQHSSAISRKPSTSTDPAYVAPAFELLRVPEPKKKKRSLTIRQKLPKAVSGDEALKILREREQRKEREAKEKEERKKERELKRELKKKEKERKKQERELQKTSKSIKGKSCKKRKAEDVSESESDAVLSEKDIPYMDSSDEFEESFCDVCPVCKKIRVNGDEDENENWVCCESCTKWWHIVCSGYSLNMGSFVCNLCDE